ncbi:MAG TPA: cytochrome c biogenesis protein CcsA [Gemmatales bacterium]|nr:cytochrome c biogenesis protein CcsA [Gemmatales bacterium]
MTTANWENRQLIIKALIGLNLVGMTIMLYKTVEPYFRVNTVIQEVAPQLQLPNYDLAVWAERPVLEGGRIKPLQTVAIETVRLITGRSTFQGQKALPLLLSWVFYDPRMKDSRGIDWDNYEFILCEDHDLRAAIFNIQPTDTNYDDIVHRKFITPWQLYRSVAYQRLIVAIDKKRKEDPERYTQSPEGLERKAHAVESRLNAYQQLTGRLSARDPEIRNAESDLRSYKFDPIHYVALDRVKNAAWFSIGELKYITEAVRAPMLSAAENAQLVWQEFMSERVALQPRLYLDKAASDALSELQKSIQQGKTDAISSELKNILEQRLESYLDAQAKLRAEEQFQKLKIDKLSDEEIQQLSATTGEVLTRVQIKDRITLKIREELKRKKLEEDKQTLESLKTRLSKISKPFIPEDPKYNILYMDYLKARFPEMYQQAIKSQEVPLSAIQTVLQPYREVVRAYHSGEPAQFQQATLAFFSQVDAVSKEFAGDNYPGVTTTTLEMQLNRVEPFKWAWISMLCAVLLFSLSMAFSSTTLYRIGFIPVLVSLGFQLFAYYCRVAISGRPPVSNMFETVIFVASMGTVFALLLEFAYRNTIIILSGSIIGTLGMVLADQLPVGDGFDSKISPLNPVLRSNYWLIIHVMTIVASYAAGALAWAIGNVSLVLYWFNSDRKDRLKNMANLCYSAMKVAVLLLAVGTMLGGIWAAESWGRFWGWDPKETWALIALVVYLIPLHARYIGIVKDFGMAVAAVVCFAGIVMSWYGVNFVIPAGLHSYGVGEGGAWQVFLLGSINLLWVLMVCHRRASMELKGTAKLV